jgi:hypothetical protein
MKRKANAQKNTLLQFAQSNRTNQKLQESIFSSTQEKLKIKKFPTLQKNKTSFHRTMQTLTDIALNVNRFGQSEFRLDTSPLRTDRRASGNTGLAKVAVQCSADTFVVNQTLVHRINICGENRHLRQARNRYAALFRRTVGRFSSKK